MMHIFILREAMKILVLGAGVIGVTTAWYLAQEGHEVLVVDRQHDVAEEKQQMVGKYPLAMQPHGGSWYP